MKGLNRRDFLRTSVAGGILATAGVGATSAFAKTFPERPARRARNLIFMVSDGMSLGTLTMAERFLRRHRDRGSHWMGLYGRPSVKRGFMDTASANSLVTDSAAASSAWGGGCRVNNGAINCRPDGTFSLPIMELAGRMGMATGLVSTATITHATPAGFAARVPLRADEPEIAEQYLERRIDVLLGGGDKFFLASKREDKADVLGRFAAAGYAVATDAGTLAAAPTTGRLLGLFSEGHMPYSLDRSASTDLSARQPTLSAMARAALTRLEASAGGFILQIEGARIDHAAHANDIGGLLHDQIAFDEAVGTVLQWVEGRDDTLVIVTSDHGNSNPGLNGVGKAYSGSNEAFDLVARFRQTNTWILEGLNEGSSHAAIRERIEQGTTLAFTADEVALVAHALRKEHREGYRVREDALIAFAQVLANRISVGWSGISHTADFTELAAFGPGSEPIQGVVRNCDMYPIMVRALGLA